MKAFVKDAVYIVLAIWTGIIGVAIAVAPIVGLVYWLTK